jgi:hypothetical protein
VTLTDEMRRPVSFISCAFEPVDNLGAYRIPPETGLLIPSVFDIWDFDIWDATKPASKSGSFDLYPLALQESDGFVNPLQSAEIKHLRACSRLLAHLVQNYQHALRFIA